ncbi:MAG: hypothetical protein U1C18_00795, partial [Patescibacteria group bacterium]|nr:hypothetical protein [Patescibacteria group bacterium]
MFHVESATSYDGGVVRQLQDVDLHAVLLASELAVFLEERLCMPVEMTYRTGYSEEKPSARCSVEFPMANFRIRRFLDFTNLEKSMMPAEW